MANSQNLKPFQKGHKKLGGRKKGVLNKRSLSLSKITFAALERVGSDGQGTGGVVGYFISILKKDPRVGARLALVLLRDEAKHPPKDSALKELIKILQSAKLNQEEKKVLARIWEKVTGTRLT
jgi:hypothetical protein